MQYSTIGVFLRRTVLVIALVAGFIYLTKDYTPFGSVSQTATAETVESPVADDAVATTLPASRHTPVHRSHTAKAKKLAEAIVTKFKTVPQHLAMQIANAALIESKAQGVEPTLILAVCAIESSFIPTRISHKDHGLMQVNIVWQKDVTKEVGGPKALLIPSKGIHAGTKVLRNLLEVTNGDQHRALRKYNGEGKDNNYPDLVLAQKREFDSLIRG